VRRNLPLQANTLSQLAGQKNILEIELSESLKRKRDELKGRLEADTSEGDAEDTNVNSIQVREAELKSAAQSMSRLSARLGEVEKEVQQFNQKVSDAQKELERLQSEQLEDAQGISKQQKTVEKYHKKRTMLTERKEQCNNSIRDLGVLPEEAFEKYIGEPSDKVYGPLAAGLQTDTSWQLLKQLHKVNEALKKYSHVNKKAVEQYTNFTSQKENLTTRREELDKSAESIEELIQVLDQRKDEAIERTFKQVSKNFEEVFEKLVPAGRGRLIMQKRLGQDGEQDDEEQEESEPEEEEEESDEEEDEDEEDEEDGSRKRKRKKPAKRRNSKAKQKKANKKKSAKKDRSAIDSYTGVSIKVSFNSKSDEGLRIQQLSGGQKSLVALAMVFAIQKCDPAPFYLFDEIDANLDADRRTAIACEPALSRCDITQLDLAMIKELSEDAQFIITTFRPELLQHADNFLGVVFDARKISSIKSITVDDAVAFVEANEGPAKA
jgi:structural maintenance of chromosome 3 (chondroitin sulfate proteoglycan 6)